MIAGAAGRNAKAPAGALVGRHYWTAVAFALLTIAGCAFQPRFPVPRRVQEESAQKILEFDTDGDGQTDYWQYQNAGGRKFAVAFAEASGRPGAPTDLDRLPAAECLHLLIALDGVPFEVVQELYEEGYFRLFYPPARVICCFPSMTDLALADLFGGGRCRGFQALYFDRRANRLSDGNAVYLSGENSPWLSRVAYRCPIWLDTLVYLSPDTVFRHELQRFLETSRRGGTGECYVYSVGTAGLGTRGGRAAIRDYLIAVDRLCEQIVHERRGRIKLTLTADHGHNLVENRLIGFDDLLTSAGYRRSSSLRDRRDVVVIEYGLVTYAEFHTLDPAGLAEVLRRHEDVEFACYRAGQAVVVCDRDGAALIRRQGNGFIYEPAPTDPLHLLPVIERLRQEGKVLPDGAIEDAVLFDATVDHEYPDPLRRLFRAFDGLVENPPDVIANLKDGTCHGSGFFHRAVGRVASTHGSLNRRNSTTFALTMLGDLPPALRTEDLLPTLQKLRQAPTGDD
jgi:hypothetical protein